MPLIDVAFVTLMIVAKVRTFFQNIKTFDQMIKESLNNEANIRLG